jgi:PKD repeat protein
VKLVDPSQWTNDFPFFDVLVDYGVGQVQIRIDANTNIFGTDVPLGTFGVTGIGGQYDPGLPLLDGYTLMPRSLEDFTDPVVASFSVPEDLMAGTPVQMENLSEGAGFFQWSFGNGVFSNEESPLVNYELPGAYNIFLTATDPNAVCSDQFTLEIVVDVQDGVADSFAPAANVFPNPTSGPLSVRVSSNVDWVAHDLHGRMTANGTWSEGTHLMDVSAWSPGVHHLQVTNGSGVTKTLRVMVLPQ